MLEKVREAKATPPMDVAEREGPAPQCLYQLQGISPYNTRLFKTEGPVYELRLASAATSGKWSLECFMCLHCVCVCHSAWKGS